MVAHASSPSSLSQEILGFLFYIVFVSLFEKGNFFSICKTKWKEAVWLEIDTGKRESWQTGPDKLIV